MPHPTKLWNRNFTLWWLTTAQSNFGTSMSGIALAFLVLHQTGSAGLMGVNLALVMLPSLLSPLAGTLVDRIHLRIPLIAGNTIRAALMLGVGTLALTGPVPLPLLYTLSLLMGLISVIDQPAAGAIVPSLVPREHLTRAMGLIGTATQTMNLAGLLIGGALVSKVGSAPSLIIDGATFLVAALLLPFIQLPTRTTPNEKRGFWADLHAGLQYARRSRILMFVPAMALFINASFAPIAMLMPKRMLDLGVGAQGFALMEAVITAGMAMGGALIAMLGTRFRPTQGITLGLTLVALVLTGFALSASLSPILALSLVMGLGLAATNTGLSVLVPSLVQPEFRGRVFGLTGMISRIGMPLSLLLLAPVADILAISAIFMVASAVTACATLAWAWQSRTPQIPEPQPAR